MCARSHASGLISAEWAVSTAASERPATRARVRSRASARSAAAAESARRGCVAAIAENATESGGRAPGRLRARAPGAAPDLDDLANGRGAPGDPRVQGSHDELEAPGLELLELRDERVEAAALLVDQHDVAGADPLGRGAARGGRLPGFRL